MRSILAIDHNESRVWPAGHFAPLTLPQWLGLRFIGGTERVVRQCIDENEMEGPREVSVSAKRIVLVTFPAMSAAVLICFCLTSLLCAVTSANAAGGLRTDASTAPASDPMNASYRLEGESVHLRHGRAATGFEAGAASQRKTRVLGEPVVGDLDGEDGKDDVALILVSDAGGSGSFYYAAVARHVSGGYRGSNAVWLGDRIVVRDIAIRNGLLIVRYLDRRSDDPMVVPPVLARTMVLSLENGRLTLRARLGGSEQLLEGWLTIGHEVRSFVPCGEDVAHWLVGNSPAMREIVAGYREKLSDSGPYTPLFAVLAGHVSEPPDDGFGADYPAAIVATRLIGMLPDGKCVAVSKPEAGMK